MNALSVSAQQEPVYKVGLVVLRHGFGPTAEVLLVKPQGKKADGNPPWVLPRGSRQRLQDGDYVDIHSKEEREQRYPEEQLEPVERTLLREAEEEAGILERTLRRSSVFDMGTRLYPSSDGPYPVRWFVVDCDALMEGEMQSPTDAHQPPEWHNLASMERLVKDGKARAGYLDIAREAVSKFASFSLPSYEIPETAPSK